MARLGAVIFLCLVAWISVRSSISEITPVSERKSKTMAWERDIEALDFAQVVGNHRVIMIGEADHYVDGIGKLNGRIAAKLFDMGIRNFIFEVGAISGLVLDQSIQERRTDVGGLVPLTGYRSTWSLDSVIDARTALSGVKLEGQAGALATNQGILFETVLSLANDHPGERVRIFGMDVESQDIGFVFEYVFRLEVAPSSRDFRSEILALFPKGGASSPVQLRQILKDAIRLNLQRFDDQSIDPRLKLALWSVIGALDFLGYGETNEGSSVPRSLSTIQNFARRDFEIFGRLKDILEKEIPPTERVAIFAHNLHVAKASSQIMFNTSQGMSQRQGYWKSASEHLMEQAADQMVVIGSTFGAGVRRTAECEACSSLPDPASIEELLEALQRPQILILRELPEAILPNRKLAMRCNSVTCWTNIRDQFDALLYVPDVSAVEH